jgi:hypothetical protein
VPPPPRYPDRRHRRHPQASASHERVK